MGSPNPQDSVLVSVPARPEYVNVLRAVTASVASRAPLTFEAIEDLQLAVDEGCARLLAVAGGARRMQLRLTTFDDRLESAVSIDAEVAPWPPPGIEESFSWRVLSALVDSVTLEIDGGPTVRMTKSRVEPSVPSEAM